MRKLVALLSLLPGLVFAETAMVNWTNATTNVDGSPILADGSPGALDTTTVVYSICDGGDLGPSTQSATVNFPIESVEIFGLTSGEWCFRTSHTNLGGNTSALSPVIVQIIEEPVPVPNPPTVVTVEIIVYTIIKQTDRFVFLPVGTIPNGTECITSETINGYNVVPRDAVTWSGSIRPQVVVARCG